MGCGREWHTETHTRNVAWTRKTCQETGGETSRRLGMGAECWPVAFRRATCGAGGGGLAAVVAGWLAASGRMAAVIIIDTFLSLAGFF